MSTLHSVKPALQAIRRLSCVAALPKQQRTLFTSSTPIPLFLDFLAPHWARQRSVTRRPHHDAGRRLRQSTQGARLLSSTPIARATAITNPRQDDEGKAMSITITPRAESRLKAIAEKDGNPDLALRVSVESGGCHGFQYLMKLINTSDIDQGDDTVFMNEDTAGDFKARVVMDEPSLELLKGSSIDYTMELIGSQFKVTGIPGAKSSCGCGTSFDIAS